MKKIIILLSFFTFYFGHSQFNSDAPWMKELQTKRKSTGDNSALKFQEVVDAFNEYWKDKDHTVKGSGYKPFMRWQNFWKDCLNDDGTIMNYDQMTKVLEDKNAAKNSLVDQSNWVSLGPNDFLDRATSNANLGRLNAIAIDPNDANVYYAGSPAGGIWKSTDAGTTWKPLTDELPQIGVSAIAVDPLDSNIIYIGTGDDDAGDTYSIGLLKSTDGGLTWNTTGLSFTDTSSNISEVYLDRAPGKNKVFVSTSAGFYKSTDGGTTFTRTLIANLNDAKLKPGDPDTIYTVSDTKFYKSTDNGDSFVEIATGLPASSSRLVMDVTPADSNYVYVLSAGSGSSFQGLYRSVDSGTTFARTANDTNIFESTQAWYDLAMAVSDVNAEEVYTGVLNVWKSSNGGDSFTRLNNWAVRNAAYTHADIHFLRFFNGELYCGSDGGFYKSTDGGINFSDLTKGMEISQFYKIAVSKQNSQKMAGGTQDNGSFGLTGNGQWNVYGGGDGMDAAIDPNNENNYYGFMQFGQNLWISNNAGVSQTASVAQPAGSSGNWITPIDINKDSEVYAAYSALYRLDGGSFTKVSPDFTDRIDELEIDPTNPDNIYVSINSTLYRSPDRGGFFTVLNSFSRNITAIEVNNNDSSIVYVVTSGTTGKVYKSTNGGQSFTDISGNLPNVPKLEIEHQDRHSDNPLFIGTNVGVYRIDDTMADWEVFDNNLPNTPITDLEINVEDGNITAATYGRGIWQSTIPVKLAQNDVRLLAIEVPDTEINCDDVATSIQVANNGTDTITSVEVEYKVNGSVNTTTWTGSIASTETAIINLPQIAFDFGINEIEVTTTIVNDAYQDNNTKSISIVKNKPGVGSAQNQFENASDEILAFNAGFAGSLWERGIPSGTVLNTVSSGQNAYGTNLSGNYTDSTRAYLVSECYNLSHIDNPVLKFNMAFDLEINWDFINVEYTTDNGANWNILGAATDPNWYNSDRLPNGTNCFNCVGAQWTGTESTMTEYSYNLAAFTNETNFIYRFNFVTDQAVNQEGVVIDDVIVDGVLSVGEFENKAGLMVYPNPSKNIFTIQWKNANEVSYDIYDITGKMIYTNKTVDVSGNESQVDLSGYTKGMYFLNITVDGSEDNIKLIRN